MNIIVACDSNYGIGINNNLPSWNLKDDLKKFKELTIGNGRNVVIMGKNTYLSFKKPLPNRINIVISKTLFNKYKENINDNIIKHNGFTFMENLKDAFKYANDICNIFEETGETWVIGGAQLYETSITLMPINKLYVTMIEKDFKCDTFLKIKTRHIIQDTKWDSIETCKNKDFTYNFYEYISN